MSATATNAVASGTVSRGRPLPVTQSQDDFYESLARFESDVVSGRLPRYSLSAESVAVLSRLSLRGEVAGSSPTVNGIPQNTGDIASHEADHPPPAPKSNGALKAAFSVNCSTNVQAASVAAFDPILLGKSDVLVRAEVVNRRQRVEKALGEALASKRRVPDGVPPWDGPNVFDASQVLSAAFCFETPTLDQHAASVNKAASTKSSDEKSYYSSLLDSRSPDLGHAVVHTEQQHAQSPAAKPAAHTEAPLSSGSSGI